VKKILAYFTLVFFLLGPAGVRPAHAVAPLAVVAVGALISATLVAGAGTYSPPDIDGGAVVDAVTGDIKRKVIIAKMFGVGAEAALKGMAGQVVLSYNQVVDWVTAHPNDFPAMLEPINASLISEPVPPPATGDVAVLTYSSSSLGNCSSTFKRVLGSVSVHFPNPSSTNNISDICSGRVSNHGNYFGSTGNYVYVFTNFRISGGIAYWDTQTRYNSSSSTSNPTWPPPPVPAVRTPDLFSPAVGVPSQEFLDEVDKIIRDYPPAISSQPVPFTVPQVEAALAQATADIAAAADASAADALALDPTNVALQIAASNAATAAQIASVNAQVAESKVEVTPEEIAEPIVEEIPALPTVPTLPESSEPPAIDFSPLHSLGDGAMEKLPFSLINSVADIFATFEGSPVAPSMDITLIQGAQSHSLSMIAWEAGAAWWRRMVAIMFHASVVYAILRRWVY
jgi:hypothetical protein